MLAKRTSLRMPQQSPQSGRATQPRQPQRCPQSGRVLSSHALHLKRIIALFAKPLYLVHFPQGASLARRGARVFNSAPAKSSPRLAAKNARDSLNRCRVLSAAHLRAVENPRKAKPGPRTPLGEVLRRQEISPSKLAMILFVQKITPPTQCPIYTRFSRAIIGTKPPCGKDYQRS